MAVSTALTKVGGLWGARLRDVGSEDAKENWGADAALGVNELERMSRRRTWA